MPRFDYILSDEAQSAVAIVRAGEICRVLGSPLIRKEWTTSKLEALYELAYLRIFAVWETCLEGIFYRSLCGYASSAGQETLTIGRHYPSLTAAEAAVLGSRHSYALWHNPQKVIDRCRGFILSGTLGCPGLQELTISSNLAHLSDLSNMRHRIVHDQADAKRKFDAATLRMMGRTYAASRPGKFLRDWDTSVVPQRRWLDTTIADLTALAGQMV